LGPDTNCKGDNIPNSIPYSVTIIHFAVVSSIGTFSFLVYGTKKSIYIFWFTLFGFLWNKQWSQALELVTIEEFKRIRKAALCRPGYRSNTINRAFLNTSNINDSPIPPPPEIELQVMY
jgi:hypothetical protein